jgi:hypothetical protein
MKLQSIRQELPAKLKADFQQDYQDFLVVVFEYLVHPVDPVKNGNSDGIRFPF